MVVSSKDTLIRPLLIIIGDTEGRYILAGRNDTVILDRESGGIHGDPFESISISDGKLHICLFGGTSWRWENNIVFEYSCEESDWLLQKQYSFYYHFEPHVTTGSYLDSTLFGRISFEDYGRDLPPDVFLGTYEYVGCVPVESIYLGEIPYRDFEYYLISLQGVLGDHARRSIYGLL